MAPARDFDQDTPESSSNSQGERTSTASAPDAEADALLLQFVKNRDATCPRCGYNVRNLTRPVCPECDERLVLRIGIERIRVGALICAIIPGIFSGMCALPILWGILVGEFSPTAQPAPFPIKLIDAFGLVSGIVAVVIIAKRMAFMRLQYPTQWVIAAILWLIHIVAFVLLLDFLIQ